MSNTLNERRKDPRVTIGYSLYQSQHAALRLIAMHEGHNNASLVAQRFVERCLRERYGGKKWRERIYEDLEDEEEVA